MLSKDDSFVTKTQQHHQGHPHYKKPNDPMSFDIIHYAGEVAPPYFASINRRS